MCALPLFRLKTQGLRDLFSPHDTDHERDGVYLFERQLERSISDIFRYQNDVPIIASGADTLDDHPLLAVDYVNLVPLEKGVHREPLRRQILDRVACEEATGFVDYITLSGSLLFSGKYATSFEELAAHGFYNKIRQVDYAAEGYLSGVEILKHDYRELFGQYQNEADVVFLIDPPYLSTEVNAYKCYWKLADYLDVLKCLQGQSYIYFTSTKSQIVELMDWFARTRFDGNPFEGAERREFNVTINHTSKYTDIMLFKNHSKVI